MSPINKISLPAGASLALAIFFLISNLHAGTFSAHAWTNDATTGIDPITTQWAYSFGANNSTTINGITVRGIPGATPSNPGSFTFTGSTSTSIDDTNELYNQGDGTATIASYFVFGGSNRKITLQGLFPGVEYTVSIFLVGFLDEALGIRTATVSSGSDSTLADQSQFGGGFGQRLDYTFTATSSLQEIDFSPTDAGRTLHIYGLALKKTPIVVTSSSDNFAQAGILRLAIDQAPEGSIITFAPSLTNGLTGPDNLINLQNGNLNIAKNLTIDGSGLKNRFGGTEKMTIDGGGNTYAFNILNSGTEIDITSATGSTATQTYDSGSGSRPATNAIDGSLSTSSQTGLPPLVPGPNDPLAQSLTINLSRDVLMGSLKIHNLPWNPSNNNTPLGRLKDITVELFDGRNTKIWTSGVMNPLNGGFTSNTTGPLELNVVFPPMRVHRIIISGAASSVAPVLAIAEVKAYSPAVTLRSLKIQNCQSSNPGGALRNSGDLWLDDCEFINNTSASLGGAIENSSRLIITNCLFSGNSTTYIPPASLGDAAGGGAISSIERAILAVRGTRFVENNSQAGGGAISALHTRPGAFADNLNNSMNTTLTLQDCEFEQNTTSGTVGGAVALKQHTASINNCRFLNNSTTGSSGRGGAVGLITYHSIRVENSLFQSNSSSRGGAIFSLAASLSGNQFIGNQATTDGGAIRAFGRITAENCLFSGNAAPTGGAIHQSSLLTLINCSLYGNAATTGSAILFDGSNAGGGLVNTVCWQNETNGSYGGSAITAISSAPDPSYVHCLVQNLDLDTLSPSRGNLDGTTTANDPLLLSPVPFRGTITPSTAGGGRFAPTSSLKDSGNTASGPASTTVDVAGDDRFVGVIDIGAIEQQTLDREIELTFHLDPDNDDYPIGVEYAIGSDPFVADFQHQARLKVEIIPRVNANPLANITYGVENSYQDRIILRLVRGNGQLNPTNFSTSQTNETNPFSAPFQQTFSTVVNGNEFFRLEAEWR